MPKQKIIPVIKWKGTEKQCYYESKLFGENTKFYSSFIKNDNDYNVGDFAFFNATADQKYRQICKFLCFFEDRGEKSAIVIPYQFASFFMRSFSHLNIEFDEYNEVVSDVKEIRISLQDVIKKCKIIIGSTEDSVSSVIDSCNLNRSIYFLCRYKYTRSKNLIPVLNQDIKNDILIEENIEQTVFLNVSPNKTPSRKVSINHRKPHTKRKNSDSMEVDEFHVSQTAPVRRNLNSSFNDSSSQDDQFLNYSIVEQEQENLKIKLRVSNGKVLSDIPHNQPIVLLDRVSSSRKNNKNNVIYELRSPTLNKGIGIDQSISSKQTQNRSKKTLKFHDLSNMIENLKIQDRSPTKVSPRKLRRLSKPFYQETFSDSESEHYNIRRKSVRNKVSNTFYSEYYNSESETDNEREKSIRSKINYQGDMGNSRVSAKYEVLDSKGENESQYQKKESKNSETEKETSVIVMNDCTPEIKLSKRKSVRRTIKSSEIQGTTKICNLHPNERSKLEKTLVNSRTTKNTPLKLIREGMLTPTTDRRKKLVSKETTPLVVARNNLHVSYVPTILTCRENEYADVYNFIEGKLNDKCGGCMYISGVPGTGKTATVTIAIENLIETRKNEGYPLFNYININGMRLTEPRQCYVEILKQLTGKRLHWEQALSKLEEKFTTKSNKKVIPTVLLVDELDILCTKRQDVVYSLLDWPTKSNAQLIVITIANTMDLPERLLMSRVTSRLGLTRLTFQAYTHKQLQEIVVNRLTGNDSFKLDAIQFVARKVASVSGDARRALDICRRAAEIAEIEGHNCQVSMKHVNAALDAMITQPKVKAIAHCSKLEKLILRSVIAEIERTGVEESIFGDVYKMLTSLTASEGFTMVNVSLAASAIYRLNSCRLLLIDQKCIDFNQRIILNVSADDVYYALKKN